jgi:inosine/xanthosine triphosphatase
MKIAVGSTNPVKIEATKLAFEKVWPEENWVVEGVSVDSEVAVQPMSPEECVKGAKNRAKKAISQLKADYGVGIEGALHQVGNDWFTAGWIVIIDKKKRIGIGSSASIMMPQAMMDMIHEGKELGVVNDLVFKRKGSHKEEGHFGLMTKNAITRTLGYRDGVIMALSRFIHPDLFD